MLHLCWEALSEGLGRLYGEFTPGGRIRRLFHKRSCMEQTDMLMIPTLGRSFELGMLYDQRSGQTLPGIWDPDDLKQDLTSRSLSKTEFEVLSGDRRKDKASALNISDSLNMSLLGGLINVEGSAMYLDHRKQSNEITRVTLKYKCTTKFEKLSMNHLGIDNVGHPSVFNDITATHVVVGLVYGAKAFFVFDKVISDTASHKNTHGDLTDLVKSIPFLCTAGQASSHLSEDQKQKFNKIQCSFFGDFLSKPSPTTFYEAVKVYHELPKILGENQEEAVPVEAWLYPLSKLDTKYAQLVIEISAGLIKQTEELFEEFQQAEQICNDLKKSHMCAHFPGIKKSITQFHSHLRAFVITIKNRLLYILPQIRGGGMKERILAQLLRDNKSGPFSNYSITKWLNGKGKEREILEAYIDFMKDTQFVTEPAAVDNMIARENDVVCFHFNLHSFEDQQLTAMKEKLETWSAKQDDHTSGEDDELDDVLRDFDDDETGVREPWFELTRTKKTMREVAHRFRDYQKVGSARVCFIVSTYDDPASGSGCAIEVYKDGKQIENNFRPPSEPSVPDASRVTFDSIMLTWVKPNYGAEFIQRYKIFYKVVDESNPPWMCLETTSGLETFTVTRLQPSTVYIFKIQGECKVGCSPPNKNTNAS